MAEFLRVERSYIVVFGLKDVGQDMGELLSRVQAMQLAGFQQRVRHVGSSGSDVRSGEHVVFSAQLQILIIESYIIATV